MRTRPFQEVVDEVIGMHGINPRSGSDEEIANAITRHINQRVRNICQDYRWPEWELTEERAFRQIWNDGRQYALVTSPSGLPDEVFYLGDSFVTGGEFGDNFGYYRVSLATLTEITGLEATDVITKTAHGYLDDTPIQFVTLTGGAGLTTITTYFVRDATADTFKVSLTVDGTAVDFTTDITDGSVQAIQNPPIGTLPTDTNFWEPIDPVDTYIDYDQVCKRSIGMVLSVYNKNPRVPDTNCCNGLLRFKPSQFGVDVFCSGSPTVFVTFQMPVPKYTMIPWVSGKTYARGDVVFDPTVGECFQAIAETDTIPADTTFWRRVPFLEKWSDYVVNESFACSIMEYSQGGQPAMQEKTTLAAYWNEKAEEALSREVNSLIIQGQKWSWSYYKHKWGCWCDSQPWSTGRVSTLTQVCEDELGFIFPTVICAPQVVWQYRHEIEALRASVAEPALDQIGTTLFLPDSLVELVILDEFSVRTRMTFQLLAGTADTGDPNGQVAPLDYDATTNVKYWFRIS